MTKVVFHPYRGDDREESIENNAVQTAIEALLPGRINRRHMAR